MDISSAFFFIKFPKNKLGELIKSYNFVTNQKTNINTLPNKCV